jgi:nicotinamide phosphoribosyltransferase
MNPLLLTDGYKVDHRRQYPTGTTLVYSNLTPRKSRIDGVDEVVFFGLQYFIKKYHIFVQSQM